MLLKLKLFHSIFIIFGCTEFATSSVQIVWKLLFQSRTCISPLWTLSLCNKEKKKVPNSHLQKNDSHQFQSLQSLRALVQPNNWSQKKKKKTRIAFVISVGSGSSDSLYTTKLQPAVFINILLHANTETVEKYPEIFLVAFWLAFTSLADRITVYFSAVDAAVFSRVRVTKSRCYHIYAVSFFWV